MKEKAGFKPTPEGLSLFEVIERFPTDDAAREHLESIRWANGIVCPHCGCNDQAKFSSIKENRKKKIRAGLRWCANCRKQFTVTVGTIFEDSHIPLRKWLLAWYLICSSKKGISSLQLQRNLKLGSYRTALFMSHRIRHALRDPMFTDKLSGTVEVDETYVGGKNTGKGHAAYMDNKTPVVSLIQRDGKVRSQVMEKVTQKNLHKVIRDNVMICSEIHTDEHYGYNGLEPKYTHRFVKHRAKEYARKEAGTVVHTNNAECFFGLLKRGIVGTFHQVSKKHLPLYLAEFDHRWNHRKVSDGERTIAGLQKAEGKRLTYKPLTGSRIDKSTKI
jgi:transposase-like protein